jgi:hypothetical protein
MGWTCSTCGREEKCVHGFGGENEGKEPLGRPRGKWKNNIKIDLQEVEWEAMDWIDLAQSRNT